MTSPGRLDLRLLAAWALLGYAALHLFFVFFTWVLPDGGTFSGRSASAGFDDLVPGVMPLAAVALAVWLTPRLPAARLLVSVALLEYLVILFFGGITLLLGLGSRLDAVHGAATLVGAQRYLVLGAANLALLALAAWATLRAAAALPRRS